MKGLSQIESIRSGPYIRLFLPFKDEQLKEFLSVVSNGRYLDIMTFKEHDVQCECKIDKWTITLQEICKTGRNWDTWISDLTLTFLAESESDANELREFLAKDSIKYGLHKSKIRINFIKSPKGYVYIPSEAF